ncbi:PglL family O-oligosaccharyltransferase [Variovorax sp. RA8]|uniref:PglL family O-oligosaccharyltransferase n=1 Tax=Variovorax sp. (strain JCM 16519 / RA8) TaxID=662548 RepID=UPI00131662EF|nr:Wzy polymerase domain-containing protein [Variovorax sp. RA8]VTU38082.1 putative bicarbonate transporter, IctB family [Variovorax sp. RA8]
MTTSAVCAGPPASLIVGPVAASAALIALPFLFPFASGPSANVWQQLATWTCAALLLLAQPAAVPERGVLVWLAVIAGAVLLGRVAGSILDLYAAAALAVVAWTACVGAGLARAPVSRQAALACGLLAAGLLSAVLGLLQYYGLAAPLVPWTTAPDLGQAYGNLRQRNQFATLISMALIAALWLHGNGGRRARLALVPVSALLLLALAASTSRTGLLQLLLISGISAWLAWRERHRLQGQGGPTGARLPPPWALLALIPAYFAAAWLLPLFAGSGVEGMMHRLREGAPAAHSRLVLWGNVLELIAQHPWTGWGWGELSFAHYTTLYEGPRFVEILDNAHNLPLHLAVELGIPAAVLICGGFGWLVLGARPWRETDPARLMAWGLLGVIVLHSLLEYPLWYGPFQLVFGLCLGFLWPASPKKTATAAQGRPFFALSLAAALALMTVVAYAAWDYTRVSQLYLAREERLPVWREDTLAQVQDSWLFANQVKFAELALMPVTRANAAEVHALAQRLVHFSPEPRVIVKLVDSAVLLGREAEAFEQAKRFRIAFPGEYARWLAKEPMEDPSE